MVDELLELFVGLVEMVANPVFAVVVDSKMLVAFGIFVDEALDETRDVPEFVAEIAAGNDFARAEGLVDAGGTTGDKAEAKRVGAVLADDFDWVNNVAFGFGHLLPFFVENHAVHIDVAEWYIVGDVEAEHNHAAYPLE